MNSNQFTSFTSYSQVGQDKFILNVLNNKRDGFFLEIGANDPCNISNTYLLETQFNWKGIMVEYEQHFLPLYKAKRPNSIPVIQDATTIDYKNLLIINNVPKNIDYLQIDLEVANGSTLRTLQNISESLMMPSTGSNGNDNYKFAVITFEHDIYHTNYLDTRIESRKIFNDRGYFCVFEDINNRGAHPFEDWWVHPDLVDMEYIHKLREVNLAKYKNDRITGKSINYQEIVYPL